MSDYTPPAVVTPTPGGAVGDGSLNGALTVLQGNTDYGTLYSVLTANGYALLSRQFGEGNFYANGAWNFTGKFENYNGIILVGLGVPPIYGLDNRTALTAADGSAITLYTTTAAGQAYHLLAHIFARGGTSPTGSYVVTFTEGGVAISKTMSVSAVDTDSDISIPCQPDNSTTITTQLTSVGGTSPSMDVYCSVKEEA